MLIKNKGASLALIGLVAIVAIGFSFFDRPHCYYDQTQCPHNNNNRTINDDFSVNFVSPGQWVDSRHDAIEALAAVGSFALTIAIAFFTGVLANKTHGLYKETSALRTIADQQRIDMERSIKAAEDLLKQLRYPQR